MPPSLPLPFTLRPNREAHPGIPDMPRARRSTEQTQAQRTEKEKELVAREQGRKNTIAKTAQVEADIRQSHEEKLKHKHNPPPVAMGRVTRPCPSDLKDGEYQIPCFASRY